MGMKRTNKRLYEKIMRNVSKQVKQALNEGWYDAYRGTFKTDNCNTKKVYAIFNEAKTRIAVYEDFDKALESGLAFINEFGTTTGPDFLIDEVNNIVYFQPSTAIDISKVLGEEGERDASLQRVEPGFNIDRKYYYKINDPKKDYRLKLFRHRYMDEFGTLILREVNMYY